MTLEEMLTQSTRVALCAALLEQLKTDEGRSMLTMAIPDMVKHSLVEMRTYRYGNQEVTAIEAELRGMFDTYLQPMLKEAVTAAAKEWLQSDAAKRFLADYCGEQLRRRLAGP